MIPEALDGTGTLLRLAWRRDHWLVPAWAMGLAAMSGISASATVDLYPTEASRIEAASVLNASAAVVALYGRVYDPDSLGELSMIKLTAFGASILGIVTLFIVIRHTRAEEEIGRADLLSAGQVGRLASLTAALLISVGMCLALGLLTSLANIAAGLPVTGSVAFGTGWAMTGVVFACVGAVVAQLTVGARAARAVGLVVLAVTYALRAAGDLAEPGPSALTWLSPIGWNQQLRAYAGNRWWVLVIPAVAGALLLAAAYALRARRDLMSGLLPERRARMTTRLSTTTGLAWRLQRGILLTWAVGFASFGLLLGSLSSSVEQLLSSSTMQQYLSLISGQADLLDAFLGAEIAITGAIAAGYAVSAMLRLRSEEAEGHAEALLATRTSRMLWAGGHIGIALAGSVGLLALAGAGLGIGAAISLDDWSIAGPIVAASLAQAPAAWVIAAIAMLAFGWLPRLASATWAVLLACVVLGEFGALWSLPSWLLDMSPLQHAPMLPVTAADAPAIIALLATAGALLLIGSVGWTRRDITA